MYPETRTRFVLCFFCRRMILIVFTQIWQALEHWGNVTIAPMTNVQSKLDEYSKMDHIILEHAQNILLGVN